MKQVQVLFSNEVVLEDDRIMKLDYCLTERVSETEPKASYFGVKITKHLDNVIEADEVTGISTSKEIAVAILKKLCLFEVTPISMVEIVDEFVSQTV